MKTIQEAMLALERARKRGRVYDYLVEKLQPFLDHDIGTSEVLIAEGCLIPAVDKSIIKDVILELVEQIEKSDAVTRSIEGLQISMPAPAAPAEPKKLPVAASTPKAEKKVSSGRFSRKPATK